MPSAVNNVTLTMLGQKPQRIGEAFEDRFEVQFDAMDQIIAAKDFDRCYSEMEDTYNVIDLADKLRRTYTYEEE